jgi:hypothetical protein
MGFCLLERALMALFKLLQYPVTATQWHPEKNSFEWAKKLQIPHSSDAVSTHHELYDSLC